jgi:hypothetical protein
MRRETPDEDQERREAEIIAERLYREPRQTVVRLRTTPAGCDWLHVQWSALYGRVREDDSFFNSERIRACHLLGRHLWEVLDDPTLRRFYRYLLGGFLILHPECRAQIVRLFRLELPTVEHGYLEDGEFETRLNDMVANELPDTCAEAARLMRAFIGEIMAELEARAARLRQARAEDAPLETSGSPQEATPEAERRQRQIISYYRMAKMADADARRLRHDRRLRESEPRDEEPQSGSTDAPEEETTTTEPPPRDPETPPAAPDESPGVKDGTTEGRTGPGGAVLPALVLVLLAPLLAGRGRATAPEPPRVAASTLEAAAQAEGLAGDRPPEAMARDRSLRWTSSRYDGDRPALTEI